MIFADIEYREHCSEFHAELLAVVHEHFSNVQSGLQGDFWIWIFDGEEKVAIDTFTSMKHQIKSPRPGTHVRTVIETLQSHFALRVYAEPQPEPHEV